jgi:hypothetical protein
MGRNAVVARLLPAGTRSWPVSAGTWPLGPSPRKQVRLHQRSSHRAVSPVAAQERLPRIFAHFHAQHPGNAALASWLAPCREISEGGQLRFLETLHSRPQ